MEITRKRQRAKWEASRTKSGPAGTLVYIVFSDEPTDALQIDAVDLDLPRPGDPIGNFLTGLDPMWCQSTKCVPLDDTRTAFIYTAEFDGSNSYEPDPLSRPTEYDYATEGFQETYYRDKTTPTAKLARNTAKTPFTNLPTRDSAIDVVTITKNVAASTAYSSLTALRNKTNAAAMTIDGASYAARTVRVYSTALTAVKTENGYSFKTQTIVVKIKSDTWDQSFESLGLQALTSSGLYWPIADPTTSAPTTTPWPLDESGLAMASRSTEGFAIVLRPYEAGSLSEIS